MLTRWSLVDIVDKGHSHCEWCGAAIRWEYHIEQQGRHLKVGSQCVNQLTAAIDPQTAWNLLHGAWRQHKQYFYRYGPNYHVYVIGPRKSGGWYAAVADRGDRTPTTYPWDFLPDTYATAEEARLVLAQLFSQPQGVPDGD